MDDGIDNGIFSLPLSLSWRWRTHQRRAATRGGDIVAISRGGDDGRIFVSVVTVFDSTVVFRRASDDDDDDGDDDGMRVSRN